MYLHNSIIIDFCTLYHKTGQFCRKPIISHSSSYRYVDVQRNLWNFRDDWNMLQVTTIFLRFTWKFFFLIPLVVNFNYD